MSNLNLYINLLPHINKKNLRLYQIIPTILLIGLVGCQKDKSIAYIDGQILGRKLDSLEYSILTGKGQYIGFKKAVQIDSVGNFHIETYVPNDISFLTILCDRKAGILVIENGQTYNVIINYQETNNIFKIYGINEEGQNLYNNIDFHGIN